MLKQITLPLLAGIFSAGLLQGQSLIYEYTFNDASNATFTESTGTASATSNFTNYVTIGSTDRVAANLFGASGSGVSGLASDHAFDNTVSNQMGGNNSVPGYGGVGSDGTGATALNGSTSFTMSGWYKASVYPTNYARLLEFGNTSILFNGGNSTDTTLRMSSKVSSTGTSQVLESNSTTLLQADEWVFFAFTYDIVTGAGAVYAGTDTSAVELLGSATLATGTLTLSSDTSTIGNQGSSNLRPFDGLMDNVRVWASDTDGSGALDLSALEAVRAADAIPEPSTYAAIFGALTLVLVVVRRRRR